MVAVDWLFAWFGSMCMHAHSRLSSLTQLSEQIKLDRCDKIFIFESRENMEYKRLLYCLLREMNQDTCGEDNSVII